MANFFDQFDAASAPPPPAAGTPPPAAAPGGNFFDRFDPPAKPAFGTDDYISAMAAKHDASPRYVSDLVHSMTSREALNIPIAGAVIPAAGAAMSAAAYPLTGAGAPGASYGERYGKDRALQDEIAGDFERENPRTAMTARFIGTGLSLAATGGTALGARLLGLVEGGLPTQIGASMASGAGINAADAYARTQDVGETGKAAAIGAGYGMAGPLLGRLVAALGGGWPTQLAARAATGAGLNAAGEWAGGGNAGDIGLAAGLGAGAGAASPMLGQIPGHAPVPPPPRVGRGAAAAGPQNVVRIAGEDVPVSQGQATGDYATQMFEQGAARNQLGEGPQRVADEFFHGLQDPAVERARANIGRSFDPAGQQVVDTPIGAGEMTGEAVRDAAQQSRTNYQGLYNEAFSLPGEIHAAAFEGIGQRIKGALSARREPIIVDDVTTPIASRALQDVDNTISQLRIQNRADPFGAPNPEEITGVNLAGVDQARKRLSAFSRATQPGSADQRAMRGIINEFDNQVEGAISNGLFTGDDRALEALQQARAAYSQHQQLFRSSGAGDDVGRTMERIIGRNGGEGATPTEISNWLYGAGKVGASGLSVRLAGRMQELLDGTPAWSAIRQGLWARMTQATEGTTPMGPQRVASRINEFLNGSGAPLAERMFSPQERTLMRQYANLQQQLIPRAGTVNYSGSSGGVAMILRHTGRALGALLGGAVSPIAGHLVGAHVGGQAAEALTQRGLAGQVARSLYRSPAQNAAEDAFIRQMGRYGAGSSRLLGLQAGQLPAPQQQAQ